jgi:hypothetical protein
MMPLSEIFFLGIVLYLLYRFIFNFFVPIVRTTKQVREQFRNMQDSMRNPGNPGGGPFQHSYNQAPEEPQPKKTDARSSGTSRTSGNTGSSNNTMGEYIDFEEVK